MIDLPTILAQLTGWWCEVLGRSDVAAGDNFLEQGGQSMQIVILLGHIEARFGVTIGFGEFLECQTMEHLAERILERHREASASETLIV